MFGDMLQRIAALGFNDQHVSNELFALLRHEEGNSKFSADDNASEIVESGAIEWQSSANEHIENDTQTPNVSPRSVVLESLKDFRCGVRRRPAERSEKHALGKCVAESEIGKLQ